MGPLLAQTQGCQRYLPEECTAELSNAGGWAVEVIGKEEEHPTELLG